MAKKKSRLYVKKSLIAVFFISFLFGMVGLCLYQNIPKAVKHSKLQECPGHKAGNFHYHTTLEIDYLGEPMTIPAGIGLEGDCIHPVHTHDTTNLVHIDYPKDDPFTLGDFFNTWGYIFNKKQFANIQTFDGYEIKMEVNGKMNTEYEKYVLHDLDKIKLTVQKIPDK